MIVPGTLYKFHENFWGRLAKGDPLLWGRLQGSKFQIDSGMGGTYDVILETVKDQGDENGRLIFQWVTSEFGGTEICTLTAEEAQKQVGLILPSSSYDLRMKMETLLLPLFQRRWEEGFYNMVGGANVIDLPEGVEVSLLMSDHLMINFSGGSRLTFETGYHDSLTRRVAFSLAAEFLGSYISHHARGNNYPRDPEGWIHKKLTSKRELVSSLMSEKPEACETCYPDPLANC